MSDVRLGSIDVPGAADGWLSLGFRVDDGLISLANGAVRVGADTCRLSVGGLTEAAAIDGVAVMVGAAVEPVDHTNSAFEIDHLVLMTDSIDRTSQAVEAVLGLAQRRIRETETVRQAFHRFPDQGGSRGCIIELVERADANAVSLWGLVINVADLDMFCATAGSLVGEPKVAVQPGRRIATVRREAGLGVAVAVMSAD